MRGGGGDDTHRLKHVYARVTSSPIFQEEMIGTYKMDPNARTDHGWTLLQIAAHLGIWVCLCAVGLCVCVCGREGGRKVCA